MSEVRKPTRYFSKRHENQIAKSTGGRKQINSGATSFYKGDVVVGDLMLIEAKTCTKEQKCFTIQKEWIEKNRKEAFQMRKPYSAVAFNFGPNQKSYYIIDESTFQLLLEKIKEL